MSWNVKGAFYEVELDGKVIGRFNPFDEIPPQVNSALLTPTIGALLLLHADDGQKVRVQVTEVKRLPMPAHTTDASGIRDGLLVVKRR